MEDNNNPGPQLGGGVDSEPERCSPPKKIRAEMDLEDLDAVSGEVAEEEEEEEEEGEEDDDSSPANEEFTPTQVKQLQRL